MSDQEFKWEPSYKSDTSSDAFDLKLKDVSKLRQIMIIAAYRLLKRKNPSVGVVVIPPKGLQEMDIEVPQTIQYLLRYSLLLNIVSAPSLYPKVLKKVMQNSSYQCILLPVALYEPLSFFFHANLIIINKYLKTVEYFEPHGYNKLTILGWDIQYSKVDSFLLKYLPELKEYSFIHPKESCPLVGFQEYDESIPSPIKELTGYCSFWSIFWAEMRIQYYKIPSKELQEKIIEILKFKKYNFRTFIRSYSNEIIELAQLEMENESNLYSFNK